jgi:outer membrane murein-binding lipoprotein Lpp
MRRIFVLGAIVAAGLWLAGCDGDQGGSGASSQPAASTLSEMQQKVQKAAERGIELVRQKKDEYEKRVGPELDRLGQRVDELKKQLNDAAEDARPEIEKRFGELKKQVEVAREKFEKVKEASGPAWEEAKKGLDAAVDKLRQALGEEPPTTQPDPAASRSCAECKGRTICGESGGLRSNSWRTPIWTPRRCSCCWSGCNAGSRRLRRGLERRNCAKSMTGPCGSRCCRPRWLIRSASV